MTFNGLLLTYLKVLLISNKIFITFFPFNIIIIRSDGLTIKILSDSILTNYTKIPKNPGSISISLLSRSGFPAI